MLLDTLKTDLITAMKARDSVVVETIRFLLAAVRNLAIAKYGADAESKLTDADVSDVIKKQVKTHTESVEAFEKAGRTELAAAESAQRAVLVRYMPSQMSDDELRSLLAPVASQGGEFGPMMGRAMKAVAGKADGVRVSGMLRELLSGK